MEKFDTYMMQDTSTTIYMRYIENSTYDHADYADEDGSHHWDFTDHSDIF